MSPGQTKGELAHPRGFEPVTSAFGDWLEETEG